SFSSPRASTGPRMPGSSWRGRDSTPTPSRMRWTASFSAPSSGPESQPPDGLAGTAVSSRRTRCLVAEGIGTAFLLMAVVGSGIMGERLSAGNTALTLLANTGATAAALVALILTFGPVSGAHFNPLVTASEAWQGGLPREQVAGYVSAQIAGAFLGVAVTHAMFGEPLYSLARHMRHGPAQLLNEFVATFGLLTVIGFCSRHRATSVPFAVASYIAAAYWFTASTSFANPAVTLARAVSDTFGGIRPLDVPGFLAAQALGAAAAVLMIGWLSSS